ncbi:MAG: cytochrome C, partial [Polyangia bacterium]
MQNRILLFIAAAALCAVPVRPAQADDTDLFLKQSPGAKNQKDLDEWRKHEDRHGLKPYPACPPGRANPADPLYRYGGSGPTSFAGPDLGMPFSVWMAKMRAQRPAVDRAARALLESRYDLTCRHESHVTMSGGKPQPIGPAARLPKGFSNWEKYAAQSPDEILKKDNFPWKPLDHPLHSTAHIVFPHEYLKVHPEHERFDVGMDIPDCFLPEFPPPLYLTTHPELGDVSRGVEITYGNYFNMFNGLLTPEQLDGLRLLVTPFQTTWFNTTEHRTTPQPSEGVSCFACHTNGHTNGAIELEPASRPNYARLRVDTPTMRGNYAELIFSSRRSIRSMDHFGEVEEYFDGDTTMLAAIGGRNLDKANTNHMGDFNA